MSRMLILLALGFGGGSLASTPIDTRPPDVTPFVTAESYYENPYFVANPRYLPKPTPSPQWVYNPFYREGAKLAKPPRSLFEIIVHDTGVK